ncbi:MAG: hypothetical protein J0M19_07390 [Sphingomonadales bacterium]|nr:hypothetical protein [Sphingomonadales bacterium]
MLIIDNAAALEAVADPNLRLILARYADMIDLATIYVIVGPADTQAALEQQRGRPLADWEFITAHPGGWYEIVVVTDDWGAGDVILIPDRAGTDSALLNLCRDHGECADDSMG